MTTNKHLNCFYKALVVEIHVILDRLYLFDYVLCEELGKWRQFLPTCLIEYYDQASSLLQVLHFRADQVLVSLDSNDWNAIVSHVCDDFGNQFSQLIMSRTFTAYWTFHVLRR